MMYASEAKIDPVIYEGLESVSLDFCLYGVYMPILFQSHAAIAAAGFRPN